MKKYVIAGALALTLGGTAQSQSLPGLDGVPGLAPVNTLVSAGSSIGALSNGGAPQLGALTALAGQSGENFLGNIATAGPGILLQGQSPLPTFDLPTIADPFDTETIPTFYNSLTFLAPLRSVVPPSTVAEFFQLAFGGNGPFLVTGLTNAANNGQIPFSSAFPAGAGALPAGDLPLPVDALDPSTLTSLLDGATLPGL